jgi:hypothetical protein
MEQLSFFAIGCNPNLPSETCKGLISSWRPLPLPTRSLPFHFDAEVIDFLRIFLGHDDVFVPPQLEMEKAFVR